jgi:hypothetical protein
VTRAKALAERSGDPVANVDAGLADADQSAVVDDLEASIRLYDELGARPRLAEVLRDEAGVFERLGRTDEAGDRRRRAAELSAAMGIAT